MPIQARSDPDCLYSWHRRRAMPESLSEPVRSLPDTSWPGREGPRPGSAESLDRTPGINGAHPRLFKEIPQRISSASCVSCLVRHLGNRLRWPVLGRSDGLLLPPIFPNLLQIL